MATARSAVKCVTRVATVALLFSGVGSTDVALTFAVLLIVAPSGASGFTLTVMPTCSFGRLVQRTGMITVTVPVPPGGGVVTITRSGGKLVENETNVVFSGISSVSFTPNACCGPRFQK